MAFESPNPAAERPHAYSAERSQGSGHPFKASSTAALLGVLLTAACSAPEPAPIDPLPSWTEGATRSAILQFVADVTEPGGPKYVPPEERIATFDNDGTLWCEQPVVQVTFAMHRIEAMAPDHPEWKDTQPFKAVLEGDEKYLVDDLMNGGHELGKIVALTCAPHEDSDHVAFVAQPS